MYIYIYIYMSPEVKRHERLRNGLYIEFDGGGF